MSTKEYFREWERKNKDKRKILRDKWKAKREKWYKDFKKNLYCQECGETFAPCLHFHHKDPSKKEFSISMKCKSWSTKRIKLEMKKCVVLCANCHIKVHQGFIIL